MLLRRQPGTSVADGGVTRPSLESGRRVSYARGSDAHAVFWMLMFGVGIGSLACNSVPTQVTNMFTDRGFTLEVASALVAYGIASVAAGSSGPALSTATTCAPCSS